MSLDKELTRRLAESISDAFNAKPDEILSKKRLQELALARFHIFSFLAEKTGWTLKRIGQSFPDSFHHSSVLHGKRELDGWCDVYPEKKTMRGYLYSVMEGAVVGFESDTFPKRTLRDVTPPIDRVQVVINV